MLVYILYNFLYNSIIWITFFYHILSFFLFEKFLFIWKVSFYFKSFFLFQKFLFIWKVTIEFLNKNDFPLIIMLSEPHFLLLYFEISSTIKYQKSLLQ